MQVETAFIALLAGMIAAIVAAWLTRLLKISEFRQAWINALHEHRAPATAAKFAKTLGKDGRRAACHAPPPPSVL